ncbi:MAG: hypothetical protein R3B13_35505 [Polyangiaceae bacterium]
MTCQHSAAFAASALLLACSVDTPLEGKRCPCIDGYICNPATNTCVERTGAMPAPSTLLGVADFQAAWATPNQVFWTWTSDGAKEDFARYEVWIATSEGDLLAGKVTRIGPEVNPELGRYTLPRTGAAEDFVRATLTDGLAPDTPYVAQLVAVDRVGSAALSDVALITTSLEPVVDVPLFADAAPAWTVPDCVQTTAQMSFSGSSHLQYTVQCSDDGCSPGGPTCWSAPSIAYDADFSGLGPGTFGDAFLEFAMAIDATSHIYWGALVLSGPGGAFSTEPVTYRADGKYRVYQIALRALHDANRQLTHADLSTAGELTGFAMGGVLPQGSVQRLDGVRVRW